MPEYRTMKIDLQLSSCKKLKSKWIKDHNIKQDILNLIEEKVGKIFEHIVTGNNFLKRITMSQALRLIIDKWALIILEGLYKAKDIFHRIQWQPTDWEKIFNNPTFERGLIPKTIKLTQEVRHHETN